MSIKIVGMSKDGVVDLLVNGTNYTYGVDAAKHVHVKRLMRYTPGKALSYLKRNANWYKKGDIMTTTGTLTSVVKK